MISYSKCAVRRQCVTSANAVDSSINMTFNKRVKLLRALPWHITITVRCKPDECEIYV
jgi:hypothetical protein